MGELADHVDAGAVVDRQRDEGVPGAVQPPRADPEALAVQLEVLVVVAARARAAALGGEDAVAGLRELAEVPGPAAELPLGQHPREGGVHGQLAHRPRLGALLHGLGALPRGLPRAPAGLDRPGDDEAVERLAGLQVRPAQRDHLAVAHPREEEQGVEHAPHHRDLRVGDQELHLLAGEAPAAAGARDLVGGLGHDAPGEGRDAREEALGDGVLEQAAHGLEHVPHGERRERPA
ncbi:MAG: hypothetical protein Q8S73_14975, partial [Deltaproteobacteria bacterium]|nr:hypothetical protein [Deltaproteobacteria bacterium]